jgi:hypothetical protein
VKEGKRVEEEINKRIIGEGASGFITKNIQICILDDKKVV